MEERQEQEGIIDNKAFYVEMPLRLEFKPTSWKEN